MQCAGNSADESAGGIVAEGPHASAVAATSSRTGKRGVAGTAAGMMNAAAGTAGDTASSADPEREAVTLLRVGSRSASRDSVLHTTVTMTPTPPPLSN